MKELYLLEAFTNMMQYLCMPSDGLDEIDVTQAYLWFWTEIK